MSDQKQNPENLISERMLNPQYLKKLLSRKDEYGEPTLGKALDKMKYCSRITQAFGFDDIVTNSIISGCELARPCYGEVGEEFLRSVDPNFSKAEYGRRLTKNMLRNINSRKVDEICNGVANVINGIDETPEEKIVRMVNYGYEYADSLEKPISRPMFISKYVTQIIFNTSDSGELTEAVIPEDSRPKRKKLPIKNKDAKMNILKRLHAHFTKNFHQIPEGFKKGMEGLSEEVIASYFVASREELILDKYLKTPPGDNEHEVGIGE